MRDINRIEPFMKILTELWLESPDLRFGQLISNISFKVKDNGNIFYVEDDELLREIKIELFDSKFMEHLNKLDIEVENIITLTDEQINIIANKFKTTEYGWYCDGCDCGEFQVEIEGIGFLVVDRSCRKSSGTPNGMKFSFGSSISIYNKSTIDTVNNESYTYDEFKEQGIKQIGEINKEQTLEILEYARQNTIKDLGYDEYGTEVD